LHDERDRTLNYTELSEEVLLRVTEELQRLRALKKQRMSELIQSARSQLEQLWNQLHLSSAERASFLFADPSQVEDSELVLERLEEELRRLRAHLEKGLMWRERERDR
jgi:Ase1/PRC1/MAP65 family protein